MANYGYDGRENTDTYGNGPMFRNNETGQFLAIGYWESTMKLSFGGYTRGNGENQQDSYDGTENQVMGYHDISALYDICEIAMSQINETGTLQPNGIRVGKKRNNILMLSPGTEYGMQPGIYLFLFKNLDSDNRTNTAAFYRFSNGSQTIVKSYDAVSGTIEEISQTPIFEFKSFVKCVRESQAAFTNAQAYSIKRMMKDDSLYTIKALAAIGRQMGLDSEIGPSPRSGKRQSNNNTPVPSWTNPNQYSNSNQNLDIGLPGDFDLENLS